ncbi:aldo/keto reductase [Desulfosediminicola flagellatus]|uniref:aldo/keto reductase n=1 Tax=Desulfosediminicola flagellatus TaxID=2569541 RepID=UPI00142F224D|nr:aldo/keto reductase [Desulfosediminicola flagellatus]
MKYRKLGKTDLIVSEIGVGCSGYWGNRMFPEERAESVISMALEHGVNFFDTGHNYCSFNAEPRLGRILKKILPSQDRSKIVVSSKAGTVIPSAPLFSRNTRSSKDFSPDYIEKTCAKSIANLNCDYLDIFQLHGVEAAQVTEPLVERLLSMKQRGMFRYLGVNTHSQEDMVYVSTNADVFDMVLIDYNVLQLDRESIISDLNQAGIGVVVGTVLAQGHLVKKKIGSLRTMADLWYLGRAVTKPASRRYFQKSRKMKAALMSSERMSNAQAAFAYILENRSISSCVFGTTNVQNLLEIMEVTNLKLEEGCKAAIRTAFSKL